MERKIIWVIRYSIDPSSRMSVRPAAFWHAEFRGIVEGTFDPPSRPAAGGQSPTPSGIP